MKKSNILNSNIFQQLLNQKERKYNCNSIIINHDYSENQVIESIDLELSKIEKQIESHNNQEKIHKRSSLQRIELNNFFDIENLLLQKQVVFWV